MENHNTNELSKTETQITQAMERITQLSARNSKDFERVAAAVIPSSLAKSGYPARHLAQLGAMSGPGLEKAKEFLPRVLAGDCLLILVGDRGPGKTQIATWWGAQREQAGKSCGWYRKTMDVIAEIKATWSDGNKSAGTENDVLKKYRTTSYLVLDEFHERSGGDWESRILVNILDHRYDNMLATVLIANMTEATARQQINPSILSRAEETGGLIVCDWRSYR